MRDVLQYRSYSRTYPKYCVLTKNRAALTTWREGRDRARCANLSVSPYEVPRLLYQSQCESSVDLV